MQYTLPAAASWSYKKNPSGKFRPILNIDDPFWKLQGAIGPSRANPRMNPDFLMPLLQTTFENIVIKGEICSSLLIEIFNVFVLMFSKTSAAEFR